MSGTVSTPNVTDFTSFLRGQVGIGAAFLPDGSTAISNALTMAQESVNPLVANVSPLTYLMAVYNLAADYVINFAPDQAGQDFFQRKRHEFGVDAFTPGVPSSASDGGTAVGLVVTSAMEGLTLSQLQNLKTPWGRAYLAIAQRFGTLWGIS